MYADALSSLIAVTGLACRVSHRLSLHAPYGVVFPAAAERGPANPQILSFCFVTGGALTLELPDQGLVRLETHDLLICAGTSPLVFRDTPSSPLARLDELRDEINGYPPCLSLDGIEDPGAGVCGQFRYRVHLFDPLGPSFSCPRIIRAQPDATQQLAPRGGWLRDGLEAALLDNADTRPGSVAAIEHIMHVLLLDALGRKSGHWGGWLDAVSDHRLGQALRLIHGWPGYAWSNSELSRRCGLERSEFVDQFQKLIQRTPLQYLRLWRMELAAHALANSLVRAPVDLQALASELGFSSLDLFRDAFSTHFGVEPEQWSAVGLGRTAAPQRLGVAKL